MIKSFTLDDENSSKWRVNHYLKRREALYSWEARVLVLLGLAKCFGIFPSTAGVFDLAASRALSITFCIWAGTKFVTLEIFQKYYPFALSRLKAKLNGSKARKSFDILDGPADGKKND